MSTGSAPSGDARLKQVPAPSGDARLKRVPARRHYHVPGESKLLGSLEEAIKASGLKDGDTISFHHHLREGDAVLNLVVGTIARMGYRDIRLAPSSLNAVNDEIVPLLHEGVITSITTSGARGELGRAISDGTLSTPVVFRSHGGRARAIEEGSIAIDVAFLAAPACDSMGNISGSPGPSSCGSLGYAMPDAEFAACVVAVTDNLVPGILPAFSIPGHRVDFIVRTDTLGDPAKISAGATRISRSPTDLLVASRIATLIRSSPVYRDGFSMQFGTGGASLAVARYLADHMRQDGVKASFVLGGITAQAVEMLEQQMVGCIFDVQCFDATAIKSLAGNPLHREVSASHYASPNTAGALVDFLDVVVLSAMEVDAEFNVNVLTGSDGVVRGASGGHSDAACGARMTIVAGPAIRGRLPLVLDRVKTVITPGRDVACVVTDQGIAWNPAFPRVRPPSGKGSKEIMSITELKSRIERLTGVPASSVATGPVVGIVEARDGSTMDVIRRAGER
jgi:citrate lyase subunit alpha/citrate CoA-transferase